MTESFSFFPDPSEKKILAEAEIATLIELFANQPDMIGRFMHEILQIGRKEVLYDVLLKHFESDSNPTSDQKIEIVQDVATAVAFMYFMEKMTIEQAESFIREALEAISRGFHGIPYENELHEKYESSINASALQVLAVALNQVPLVESLSELVEDQSAE